MVAREISGLMLLKSECYIPVFITNNDHESV